MTTQKQVKLLICGLYYFAQKNHLLASYNQEVVKFKVLENLKVTYVEYPMETFLNFQPMLQGKI